MAGWLLARWARVLLGRGRLVVQEGRRVSWAGPVGRGRGGLVGENGKDDEISFYEFCLTRDLREIKKETGNGFNAI